MASKHCLAVCQAVELPSPQPAQHAGHKQAPVRLHHPSLAPVPACARCADVVGGDDDDEEEGAEEAESEVGFSPAFRTAGHALKQRRRPLEAANPLQARRCWFCQLHRPPVSPCPVPLPQGEEPAAKKRRASSSAARSSGGRRSSAAGGERKPGGFQKECQ